MKDFLHSRLRRTIRRLQWLRLSTKLTVCWTLAALIGVGFVLLQRETGWSSALAFSLLAGLLASASVAVLLQNHHAKPDERAIAQKIEDAYPELRGLLLTAVQHLDIAGREQSYLEYRVLHQAVEHCQQTNGWRRVAPFPKVQLLTLAQFAALAVFVATLAEGRAHWKKDGAVFTVTTRGLTVTPGDTDLERGESLVVLARFGDALPPGVDLVVNDGKSPARKIPLVKSLADPVFGGSVPEVAGDLTYHLDYAGGHTRNFSVKVFEHPRLARADVELKFPAYTNLPPKRIEDTRRVSAVEGTQLGLTLQLNKPVASATLVARNKEKTEIPLTVAGDKAVASLSAWLGNQVGPATDAAKAGATVAVRPKLETSQSYDLKLVDAEGRTNKLSAPFVIEVLPNRPPELKLASPRGDVRPSALEEISFEGTVWDDFGAPAYGLAYTVAGGETKFVELGQAVPAKEKRPFNYLVRLEDLGVKPDDLVSWYAWADDFGPDGKLRRTSTDMFFAEVRPFDEIFRESQGMQPQDQNQQQAQGDQARRLTELQKQIISATWKLQRDPSSPKYADDTSVVHDSQEQALAQAIEAAAQGANSRRQGLWSAATTQMEEALKQLEAAAKSPKPLASALTAEQAAYQSLLKLQPRDTDVTRSRSRSGQSGQQANQRQIDQLDLTQAENRYETQRQARAPQTPERREQNQVLNRLQELARRQEDVNERLKELQTALQAAKTDQEKEDVRRQLKRLQEEQQQMLADMDELKQRMERPENQSAMQQQREQLDQTRNDAQRAADAAGQGSVAQALASGTRAQRQLQQMREDLRKQSSSEFSDDLRQMRNDARDLAQQQDDLGKKIAALDDPKQKKLNDAPERQAALDQLEQQRKRMGDLVDRATQVSEQAENSEPLLAKQLYDSVRKISQDDVKTVKDFRQELLEEGMLTRGLNDRLQQSAASEGNGKSLELTTEMLQQGYLPQAGRAAQRAGEGINELKRGVERAAESVLGDDAEALKLARSELDAATKQLERELAQDGKAGTETTPAAGNPPNNQDGTKKVASADQTRQRRSNPSGETPAANGEGSAGQSPSEQTTAANGDKPSDANQPGGARGQPSGQRGAQPNGGNRDSGAQRLAGGDRGGGGGDTGGLAFDTPLNGDTRGGIGFGGGPITTEDFAAWADRLRDVEGLLEQPALRDAVANARERARQMRQDFKRDRQKPDWAVVQLQVLKPLVEVRSRIGEELARRDAKDPLVPIDRDPVPNRFAESVRRYYEELGKDK